MSIKIVIADTATLTENEILAMSAFFGLLKNKVSLPKDTLSDNIFKDTHATVASETEVNTNLHAHDHVAKGTVLKSEMPLSSKVVGALSPDSDFNLDSGDMIETKDVTLVSPKHTMQIKAATEFPKPIIIDFEDVDASGTPWNPQLHARNKTKNAKGMWKSARKALLPTPPPIPKPPKLSHFPVPPAIPTPPPLPVPPAPIDTDELYMQLLDDVTDAVDAGKLSQADIVQEVSRFVTKYGLPVSSRPSLAVFANRTDLIPQVRISLGL